MIRQKINLIVVVMAVIMGISIPSAWAGYTLVPGFGDSGIVQEDIGGGNDRAYDMVVQSDGRVVVVGVMDNGSDNDFAIVRYTAEGAVDTTFSFGDQIGSGDDVAYAVTLLDDGSFVVAGATENSEEKTDIVVAKVTSEGVLDVDFGGSGTGYKTFHLDAMSGVGYDVGIDEDGNILVAGTLSSATDSWAVVVRFSATGALDTSFGSAGYRLIEKGDKTAVYGLGLEADGRIVLAGMVETKGEESGEDEDAKDVKQAALFRLNGSGDMDTDYGTDGMAVVDVDGSSESLFRGLTVLDSGAVVAVGYQVASSYTNILTAKFTASGLAVSGFGENGTAIFELGDDSIAYSVAERSDSSLMISGEFQNDSDLDIVLLHLDNLGAKLSSVILTASEDLDDALEEELVASLAEEEAIIKDINTFDDSARKVAIVSETSNRVYVAGYTKSVDLDEDIVLLAYEPDSDSEDDGDYGSGNSTNPAFFVGTLSVNNIQSTSAMSGGVITVNNAYFCEGDGCTPTVEERGVVYAVVPYPSYRENDGTDTATSTTSTTSTDSVFPDWVKDAPGYSKVRYGRTSDGSSVGTFGSDMEGLSPETIYYVRAYALLSDGTVLYGNQYSFITDDACFIATAAYGSMLAPHVQTLRAFRDTYMKTTAVGRYLVKGYYRWSPPLAELISQSPFLRFCTRLLLLPAVVFSYLMVSSPFSLKLAVFLLAISMLYIQKKYHSRSWRRYEPIEK